MTKKIIVAIGIVALAAGGFFSIRDWRVFRYEETKNFGQGPVEAEVKVMYPADKIYQNNLVGVRIKYPKNWTATTNPKLIGKDAKWSGERVKVADFDGRITLSVEKTDQDLTSIANAEAAMHALSRERDHYSADNVVIDVLTWKDNGVERQMALAKKFTGKLIILEQTGVGGWEDMLKSLVIF